MNQTTRSNPWASLACAAALAGTAHAIEIKNEALRIDCEESSGRITLSAGASGGKFFRGSFVRDKQGQIPSKVERADVDLPAPLGRAPALRITWPGGDTDEVCAPAGTPFAVLRRTVRNQTDKEQTFRQLRVLDGVVTGLAAPDGLKTLGTGGLRPADAESGSYMWAAVAEPGSRKGVVAAWLTTARGSGIVTAGGKGKSTPLRAHLDYGRLPLQPGQAEALELLAIGAFDDARLGLEAWADLTAKVLQVKLPPQPAGYCTWYHGGASNEREIARNSEIAARELKPFGFSVMQIDDGWQAGIKANGPCKVFAEPKAKGPYPSGMKQTADTIRGLGLTPGLWLMPFAGTHNDPFFADKQDWFAKGPDGKPFDTKWGGTCLDCTKPEVLAYIRDVVRRIVHDWGYSYLKLDGLYTGAAVDLIYVNDDYKDDKIGNSTLSNPLKTHIEAYRDGLRSVREAAGKETYILGCCANQNMRSYGGAFGLVDAMRVGPDNGPRWPGLKRGPDFGSRNYFLHGRIWYNDPDPVYVRPALPENESRLVCTWVALSGQVHIDSDNLSELPPERLDLLRRGIPAHRAVARPVDLFESRLPRVWMVTDSAHGPRRDVAGFYNWTDQAAEIRETAERLGLPKGTTFAAFDYWGNTRLPDFTDALKVSVPARSCKAVAIRALAAHPVLLSTSRHLTQGIVDVAGESWDASQATLGGRCQVIGNGSDELRILTESTAGAWTAASATAADGTPLELSQESGMVRIRIAAKKAGEVSWQVKFTKP